MDSGVIAVLATYAQVLSGKEDVQVVAVADHVDVKLLCSDDCTELAVVQQSTMGSDRARRQRQHEAISLVADRDANFSLTDMEDDDVLTRRIGAPRRQRMPG